MTTFPTRIRSERERLGLTQAQVAERMGMSRGAYLQYENGRRADPQLSTLARLLRAGFRLRLIAPELFERNGS